MSQLLFFCFIIFPQTEENKFKNLFSPVCYKNVVV